MNCEYSFINSRHDSVDNFISSVNHYSKNTGCLLAEAFRELSLYAYKWVLNHFDKKKAHRIHHNVICHSFFWLAFVKAYSDRSKPGRNKYDPERMARNLAQGQTAMLQLGDPLDYERKVFVTLGQLFDDVRHQKLAVGVPCRPDYSKQEEIVTHLVKLARDKRNDTVCLPASVPEAKQVLNPSHPWYSYDDSAQYCRRDSRMASSERTEQDPTQASMPESTDTEMYQALEKDLLISSDYQAGLAQNVAQVLEVAGGVKSTRDVHSVQFREPDEEEEEIRRTPGTRDEGCGQSILKKMTVNTSTGTIPRQPHTISDIPSGVGSPLAKHPGNHVPSGDFSFRSGFQPQLQMFQSHAKKTYDWYTSLKQSYPYVKRSSSRKRERQTQPKPLMETPTQSPLKKTGRLQSVVSVVQKEQPKRDRSTERDLCDDDVPACRCTDETFETVPYHLIGSPETIAEQFVLYCMDRFSRDDFEDKVNDFGNVFGHQTAFIAHYCMATAVHFEVTWVRGERWIFPNIPPEMEKMMSRRGATLPASPKESMKRTGIDVSARCLKRWRYFLALMQFWKDETTPFQYGRVVRHDSKVLLYIMFRLKAILKSVDFQFHHYAVKNMTTWNDYARRHLTNDG